MDEDALRTLLNAVQSGSASLDEAIERLRRLPYEDLGYARLDNHRALRRGFPEVVLGSGKTVEQLVGIVGALLETGSPVLATRLDTSRAEAVMAAFPAADMTYHEAARCLVHEPRQRVIRGRGPIAVLSAGTSDIPVADEASVTAEVMGNEVHRVYDVGVSGVHRVLLERRTLDEARVVIVAAGMEGALPSVVGGLVACPVIAVPTSIGYGASFSGLAALLGMLNSCASGVTVVNIDNGFGAGYAAALMNRRRPGGE